MGHSTSRRISRSGHSYRRRRVRSLKVSSGNCAVPNSAAEDEMRTWMQRLFGTSPTETEQALDVHLRQVAKLLSRALCIG